MGEPTIEDSPVYEQPPPLTFEVVKGASKSGQQKLFDSCGYSYCVKRRRNTITYWHCSFRDKSNHCLVSVIPEGFTVVVEHNHVGEVGLPETAKLTARERKATRSRLSLTSRALCRESVWRCSFWGVPSTGTRPFGERFKS
ncbi:unnamed protein product [Pocillopora meandrina]|uniref:FLYWCH-type domain-containing protein n=1 Tax=Pocillopora meandrina TaxID=46732 RepID=A0AAU9XBC6_9CNID|nr:unnamed protein product [Pocillopora meandrina]